MAAALSVDGIPLLAGLADTADGYFFTSYHHAVAGDKGARQGITELLVTSGAPWQHVTHRYSKLLDACADL